MLFNSYEFILLFLPLALTVFFVLGKKGFQEYAIIWLVCASLFYYGWWNPSYLWLIIGSILFNYTIGRLLSEKNNSFFCHNITSKSLLTLGVAGNLFLLGYFKYTNFFIDNVNFILETNFYLEKIILPLAISFFTFQQVTFLIDSYKGLTREYSFSHYCLFVTFFPQLIAGPIVHHQEMLPQFAKKDVYKISYENLSIGLTIFFIGLFKKIVVADGIAIYAARVFGAVENNITLTLFEAWGGALAYTFQLYFDFSGYSDMAIGLARMFGILLPLNFHSPYKANNIIEFWRRWHITLSRFLRDYLYIPLGGNRKGHARRYINIFITMVIGGFWHGASWTFVAWGMLHGLYLIINHWFHMIKRFLGYDLSQSTLFGKGLARFITFSCVVIGWVFFRSQNIECANNMLQSMFGLNGVALPQAFLVYLNNMFGIGDLLDSMSWIEFRPNQLEYLPGKKLIHMFVLLLIVFCLPNTQEYMHKFNPAFEIYKGEIKSSKYRLFQFRFSAVSALLLAFVALLSLLAIQTINKAEFLYYDF